MSGKTNIEKVVVFGENGEAWVIDANGRGEVTVISDPPLVHTTDSVAIGDGVANLASVSATGALKVFGVSAGGGGGPLDHTTDSVAIGDGVANLASVSATGALKVFGAGGGGAVSGNVTVIFGLNTLQITAGGSAPVTQGTDPWTVDGTVQITGAQTVSQVVGDIWVVSVTGQQTVSQVGGDVWAVDVSGETTVSQVSGDVWIVRDRPLHGFNQPGALSAALDGVSGRSTHFRLDVTSYREFMLAGNLATSGTPTDFLIEARYATNQTTSAVHPYRRDFWADLRWDDVAIGANGTAFALDGPCFNFLEIFMTMTGGGTVTTSNVTIHLRS